MHFFAQDSDPFLRALRKPHSNRAAATGVSGHHESILDPGEWKDGTEFLTRPFTTDALVGAVRELLRPVG